MQKILFLSLFSLFAAPVFAQKQASDGTYCAVDTIKGSPKREIQASFGANQAKMQYYSPGVKGRIIWGGLVAYNKVWVTGAHYATNIEFSQDVMIGETRLKAGKYAFFTIPNKKTWTLIINRNWEQHLADEYDAKDDLVRLEVKPERLKTEVSRLLYTLSPLSDSELRVSMAWEKIRVSFLVRNAQ